MNINKFAVVLGNVTSKIGNLAYSTILSIWILDVFNDSKILGELKTYMYATMILLNLISGHISDRFNRKYILIFLDFCSSIICLLFYFIGLGKNSDTIFYNLLILNIVLIINSTFFSTTLRSIIPEIINNKEIRQFNSIISALGEVLKLLVPSISVILYKKGIVDFDIILIFNGITFFISSIFELFIEYSYNKNVKTFNDKFITKFMEGFNYIYKNKKIMFLLIYASIINIFNAIFELLVPYYFNNIIISPYYLSLAYILEAIGGILASVVIIKYNEKKIFDFKFLILLQIIPFILLMIQNKIFFTTSIFIATFIGVIFNILFFSYIQESVEKGIIGRVFSVIFFVSGLGIPIGSFIFSKIFLNYNLGISILVFLGITVSFLFSLSYKFFFERI